jgi:hypothetical protein
MAIAGMTPDRNLTATQELPRFLREGAATAWLNYPNAVRVWDSGMSDKGIAYLIMDLLEGFSLPQELVPLINAPSAV